MNAAIIHRGVLENKNVMAQSSNALIGVNGG
jgi:hypothetical protein